MKKLLLIACVAMSMTAAAQTKGFTEKGVNDVVVLAMDSKLTASVVFISDKNHTLSSSQIIEIFSTALDTVKTKSLPIQYKDFATSIYTIMGKASNSLFLSHNNGIPLLLPYKDGNVLIINPLMYLSSYNTLQLNDRERALITMKNVLFPVIYESAQTLKTDIKYIGFSVCYGAKDFSDKYAFSKGEFALIVLPVSVIKNFAATHISEDELLKYSDIYISNKDAFGMVFKVDLSLK